jgi:hypothetical protein
MKSGLVTLLVIIIILVTGWNVYAGQTDRLSLDGYFKNFSVVYDPRFPDNSPPLGSVSNRLRINARYYLNPAIAFETSYNLIPRIQDNRLFQYSASFYSTESGSSYRVEDFDSRLYPKKGRAIESFGIYHNLDRALLKIRIKQADIFIGRQAIAWGFSRVINPTDIFIPFIYDELDTEERIGIDALRVRVPIGFMGEFDGGYVFGDEFKFSQSAFYLRGKFNASGTDFSLIALNFKKNIMAGFDLTRAIGGAGFWLEGAYVFPGALDEKADNDPDYFRGTIGADYSFGDRTYGFIEYHYNQPGRSEPSEFLSTLLSVPYRDGGVFLLGEHYIFPGITYQFTPLVIFSGILMYSLSDNSALITPYLEYNIAENFYLAGGAYIGFGKKGSYNAVLQQLSFGSEFGDYSDSYFGSFRFYF